MTYPRISWSQASKECGLQLRFYRERAPKGLRGISPSQGSAVHAGIEDHMVFGDPESAVAAALAELDNEIIQAGGVDRIRWDDPPRLTKPFRDNPYGRVYSGDEGNMQDVAAAQAVTAMMVRGWCEAFPSIRVTPFAHCPRCGAAPEEGDLRCSACAVVHSSGWVDAASLLPVERKEQFSLDRWGMPGWTFTVVYDIEPDEGGMLDIKVSAKAFDCLTAPDGTLYLNPHGKHWSKRGQALLYMLGQEELYGEAPEWFVFHNMPRTGLECVVEPPDPFDDSDRPIVRPIRYDPRAIQVVPVEYDRAAAEAVIEHVVKPTVLAIERGIWRANTSAPFPCSEKFCDYFAICPLGQAARGGNATEAPPEEARGAA